MVWGIPVPYFAVWFGISGFCYMLLPFKIVFMITGAIYAVMWSATQYEPKFGTLLPIVFRRTPAARNKSHHQGHMYRA